MDLRCYAEFMLLLHVSRQLDYAPADVMSKKLMMSPSIYEEMQMAGSSLKMGSESKAPGMV